MGEMLNYYLPDGRVVDFDGRELLRVPENLVDVELHARMYGFEITEERTDYERIKRREELTYHIANNPSLIPLLVKLFHNRYVEISAGKFSELAQKHGVISRRGNKFIATNRDYIGGKWLEEFTFLKLLNSNFFDVRIGVKVKWYGETIQNEIDVMATKKNRLYLFSCKTGKNTREILKHLYELEELTERIGGDFGKSYLVITENLYTPKPPEKQQFPNAPSVNYRENKEVWYKYYKTNEGKAYQKAWSNHISFKNLAKRAKLLGIKILTPESF
jgi:hypothetical protein